MTAFIMPMFDPFLLIITVVFMLIGMMVSGTLKKKFAKYSQTQMISGISGKEVAAKMLKEHGIMDVQVISVDGQLSDHYNPAKKTVNLSHDVYNGKNVASAAIAAHECGHAVQHATAYSLLQLRTQLVPVVNISSMLMNVVFLMMSGLVFLSPNMGNTALIVVIVSQGLITLFSLITLPVEIDASKRALAWLDNAYITRSNQESVEAKDALTWAALTYLVAALASIATLLYFILRFTGKRD